MGYIEEGEASHHGRGLEGKDRGAETKKGPVEGKQKKVKRHATARTGCIRTPHDNRSHLTA